MRSDVFGDALLAIMPPASWRTLPPWLADLSPPFVDMDCDLACSYASNRMRGLGVQDGMAAVSSMSPPFANGWFPQFEAALAVNAAPWNVR